MVDRLGVPPELNHLIEKRAGEERREEELAARLTAESADAVEDVASMEELADVERRSGTDRRDDDRRSRPSGSSQEA